MNSPNSPFRPVKVNLNGAVVFELRSYTKLNCFATDDHSFGLDIKSPNSQSIKISCVDDNCLALASFLATSRSRFA